MKYNVYSFPHVFIHYLTNKTKKQFLISISTNKYQSDCFISISYHVCFIDFTNKGKKNPVKFITQLSRQSFIYVQFPYQDLPCQHGRRYLMFILSHDHQGALYRLAIWLICPDRVLFALSPQKQDGVDKRYDRLQMNLEQ